MNNGLQEVRIAGASKGIALSTAAARQVIPQGTDFLELLPRNFSTAVVARFALCPYLAVLKTIDALASPVSDYSAAAQDGDAATDVVLSSLDTLANGDFLLIGSHLPFRGLSADVDAPNGNASVLLVEYWNGSAWVTISASDGTTSGGATMAIDGDITWTIPAAWTAERLRQTGLEPAVNACGLWQQKALYWLRLSVSAALDASCTLNAIVAMPRSTVYGELISGEAFRNPVSFGPGGISGIEALTDAGTANLIANCYASGGFSQG
jgi:hypothetical protein